MAVLSSLERNVNTAVEHVLDELASWYFKTWGSKLRAGLPDYIACVRGVFVAIECKAPGARRGVTRRQAVELDRIRRAGGIAVSVRGGEDLVAELTRRGLA